METNGTEGIPEYAKSQSSAFSMTTKESEQLEKEYEINDILWYLYKAAGKVGENMTISLAIKELGKETRFAEDIKNKYIYGKDL